MTSLPPGESFEFQKTITTPSNAIWTVRIAAHRLNPGDRGPATWPPVRWAGRDCAVEAARAWGGPPGNPDGQPVLVWTFRPTKVQVVSALGREVINPDVPLANVPPVLELAGVKWSAGGRRGGESEQWRSNRAVLADIERELRKGARSAKALATRLGVDPATIYRRIRKATSKRFSEYLDSCEFVQQRGQ